MKSPVIRKARAFDAPEIAAISTRPHAAGWSREAYAKEAERPDAIFFVADAGPICGYIMARADVDEVQLLDFVSAREGEGVGRNLWTR